MNGEKYFISFCKIFQRFIPPEGALASVILLIVFKEGGGHVIRHSPHIVRRRDVSGREVVFSTLNSQISSSRYQTPRGGEGQLLNGLVVNCLRGNIELSKLKSSQITT